VLGSLYRIGTSGVGVIFGWRFPCRGSPLCIRRGRVDAPAVAPHHKRGWVLTHIKRLKRLLSGITSCASSVRLPAS
jgi:hypothetical protein